jgi:hypothetical protein
MKFKIQTVEVQLVIIKLPQVKKWNFNTMFPLLKIIFNIQYQLPFETIDEKLPSNILYTP